MSHYIQNQSSSDCLFSLHRMLSTHSLVIAPKAGLVISVLMILMSVSSAPVKMEDFVMYMRPDFSITHVNVPTTLYDAEYIWEFHL